LGNQISNRNVNLERPKTTIVVWLNRGSQGIRQTKREGDSPMKFYIFIGSPRAFKVMAVANHLGLDYELQQLDPTNGEHLSAAYAAVNPNKRIPTMEDEGFILWESNAITQYLASRKPEAGLLPPDERARALVNQWQFWDISSWDPACASIVFERLVKKMLGMGEPDPAKVQEGEQNFHRYAQILNDISRGGSL
jgi:glutathione S-transferase